jgi:glycosyltransferase involved in cell wall biosynthesis
MLSIVIPSLNEEKHLPLLLASIKDQDFSDYEIIVADAGSTDRTREIAEKYGCKVVEGGPVSVGRNRGAEVASGEFLFFIDADSILPSKNFLGDLNEIVIKKNIGVAGFPILPIGGIWLDRFALSFWNTTAKLTQAFLPHAAAIIFATKEVHRAIGGFDETIKLAEDHHYVRQGKKISKFVFLDKLPVHISIRRYEKDGRIKTYIKFILAELYMMIFGPIRTNIFDYKFNHYNGDQK